MDKKVTWQVIGDFKVSNYLLGKGQSGEVYYGIVSKTGEKVAAKKININQLTANMQKQLQNEIKNMTKLTSPFVVRLFGYMRYQKEKEKESYLYLFLQYCEDIDMKKYLQNNKKKQKGLCQAEALLFMRHIIQGYKDLHKEKIIHRDIKPANILLKQGVAKLSDFGFSRVVEDTEVPGKFTLLGTPLYTAPEILKGAKFSSKCDVWSVGVLFYEMLYGSTPWTGKDLNDLRSNILNKPLQLGDSVRRPELKELLKRMLSVKDEQRMSWDQIFSHPIFKEEIPKAKINNDSASYKDYKEVFLEYIKSNIVKSYLRLNIKEINFKEPEQPMSSNKNKDLIKDISRILTHKRNIAFLYAYVLALYYNNDKLIPKTVNEGMQFEYGLTKQAFNKIALLGATYVNKSPDQYSKGDWEIFKKSAEYEEMSKILNYDYQILHRLINQISAEVQKCYKSGQVKSDKVEIIKNIDKPNVFEDMMKINQKELKKKSNTGVCGLIAFYIDICINPKEIQENQFLQFGPYYELRERQYGLS